MTWCIAISGPTGSGKSTLTRALAIRTGTPSVGFGDFLRAVATRSGIVEPDVEVLRTLGAEHIRDGWDVFVRRVLDFAGYSGGSLIVDGVRHIEALHALRELTAPAQAILVALEVDALERERRLAARGEARSAKDDDRHPIEVAVDTLRRRADIVIPAGQPVEASVDLVLNGVNQVCSRVRPG